MWVDLSLSVKYAVFTFANARLLNPYISGKYLTVYYVSISLILAIPYIIQNTGYLLNVQRTTLVLFIWSEVETI